MCTPLALTRGDGRRQWQANAKRRRVAAQSDSRAVAARSTGSADLHRLSTRQTIEQHGIAELYERFASAGARAPVQNDPSPPEPASPRRGRILKRNSGVDK
jgi:hypothetical protein